MTGDKIRPTWKSPLIMRDAERVGRRHIAMTSTGRQCRSAYMEAGCRFSLPSFPLLIGALKMGFSWTGLLLAPLLAPVLIAAGLLGLFGADRPALLFLVLLVPGCIISYGTTIVLFLPSMFVLSRWRAVTGYSVCVLGLVLGLAAHVAMTWVEWGASGPDSGPPTESFFSFFLRWTADPLTAVYPVAGLLTAGTYWWLGTRRRNRQAV
jgi:hypothetical protein